MSEEASKEFREFESETREELDKLISKYYDFTPPAVLYHYTTPAGLLGIYNSRSIYATSTHFLNDEKEVTFVYDLMKDLGIKHERYMPSTNSSIGVGARDTTFVTSFSEESDLLSQWRGYVPTGGYSVGFNATSPYLGDNVGLNWRKQGQWNLVKVQYDAEVAKEVILKFWEKIKPTLDKQIELKEKYGLNLGSTLATRYYQMIAICTKHNGFKEEQEWRLIGPQVNSNSRQDLQFRSSNKGIVPYIKWNFKVRDAIDSITVGPNLNFDSNISSLHFFVNPISETSEMPGPITIKLEDGSTVTKSHPDAKPRHKIKINTSTIPYLN